MTKGKISTWKHDGEWFARMEQPNHKIWEDAAVIIETEKPNKTTFINLWTTYDRTSRSTAAYFFECLTSTKKEDRDYAKKKVQEWADQGKAMYEALQNAIEQAKQAETKE